VRRNVNSTIGVLIAMGLVVAIGAAALAGGWLGGTGSPTATADTGVALARATPYVTNLIPPEPVVTAVPVSTPMITPMPTPAASPTVASPSPPSFDYIANLAMKVLGPDEVQLSFDWGYSGDSGVPAVTVVNAANCSTSSPVGSEVAAHSMFDTLVGVGHEILDVTGKAKGTWTCTQLTFDVGISDSGNFLADKGSPSNIVTHWAQTTTKSW